MTRLGFRTYLFLAMSLLAAAPVAALGAYQYRRLRADAEAAADEQNRFVALTVSTQLSALFRDLVATVETTARLADDVEDLAPARLQRITDAEKAKRERLAVLGICDRNAIALVASPPIRADGKPAAGTDYKDRAYYQELVRTQRTTVSEVVLGRVSGIPEVVVASPVRDPRSAELRAYAYAAFQFNAVTEATQRASRLLSDVAVTVLDPKGRVLTTPSTDKREALRSLATLPLYRPVGTSLVLRQGLDENGEPARGAAIQLAPEDGGWTIVVARPERSILEQAARAGRSSILFACLALAIALAVAAWLANFIAGPLRQLAEVAEALGAGDFSREPPPLTRFTPREGAQLITAFQGMVSQLRTLVLSLQSARDQMDQAFAALGAVGSQQVESVGRQNEALGSLSSTAEQIRDISARAAQKARTVLRLTGRADEVGRLGQQSLDTTLQALDALQEQSRQIQASLAALLDRTTRIDQIASTVRELAERSDIVALNAAVEAARASQAGRVFTVVSEEMRSLADQSAQCAKNISSTILDLIRAVRSTATVGDATSTATQRGLEQLRDSGERVRELATFIGDSSSAARDIASDVREQAAAIAEAIHSLEILRSSMEETERSIRSAGEVAAALGSARTSLGDIIGRFQL